MDWNQRYGRDILSGLPVSVRELDMGPVNIDLVLHVNHVLDALIDGIEAKLSVLVLELCCHNYSSSSSSSRTQTFSSRLFVVTWISPRL